MTIHIAEAYLPVWTRFLNQAKAGQLGQAVLLMGDCSDACDTLVGQMVKSLSCCHPQIPCESCQSCQLVFQGQHPDVHCIVPDKPGGSIKIEQIRSLQELVVRSPRLSSKRVILITSADKMNKAAANALLKMLEEPNPFVYFLLVTSHLSYLPPTVVSRCQRWMLPSVQQEINAQLPLPEAIIQIAHTFFKNIIGDDVELLATDFNALLQGTITAIELADKWCKYPLVDLSYFLYRITAFLIGNHCSTSTRLFSLVKLYEQLDKISQILDQLNRGITVNALLALETILLGYELE